ncbi:MAG: hypothetical protein ACOY90_15740, partial [Candidatus Zhuqueibacterota bacterium]
AQRSNPLHSGRLLRRSAPRNDRAMQQAADYLNQAVTGLREAGEQIWITKGLLERAGCYRLQSQIPQAWDDLAEAQEIAERGDMKLWLVDYHLEAARVCSCQLSANSFQLLENGRAATLTREDMIARLKLHVEQAEKLVQETGYHRRDPEVALGYAGLFLAREDLGKAREHLVRAKKLLDEKGIRQWDFEVQQLTDRLRALSK